MIRFGLCCLFRSYPIRFRTLTAKIALGLGRQAALERFSFVCLSNLQALTHALQVLNHLGIGAFRILSPLFPRMTHPKAGYQLIDLPNQVAIETEIKQVHDLAKQYGIRLSFHPDQFVVLSSSSETVVQNSLAELEYLGFLAENLGAEVINLHAGGSYGDKRTALGRFRDRFGLLSKRVQERLTLENDDVSYTVEDLLPVCRELKIPLVYDVHHHRLNPDRLSETKASHLASETFLALNREPTFHISSPKQGWQGKRLKSHADFIDPRDFPKAWLKLEFDFTLETEAKAKELAVIELMQALGMFKKRAYHLPWIRTQPGYNELGPPLSQKTPDN